MATGPRATPSAPIVRAGLAAATVLGFSVNLGEGSTGSNIPMSMNVPAITIGGGVRGRDAPPHRVVRRPIVDGHAARDACDDRAGAALSAVGVNNDGAGALLAAAAAARVMRRGRRRAEFAPSRPNVLCWSCIDTLRADALGACGAAAPGSIGLPAGAPLQFARPAVVPSPERSSGAIHSSTAFDNLSTLSAATPTVADPQSSGLFTTTFVSAFRCTAIRVEPGSIYDDRSADTGADRFVMRAAVGGGCARRGSRRAQADSEAGRVGGAVRQACRAPKARAGRASEGGPWFVVCTCSIRAPYRPPPPFDVV